MTTPYIDPNLIFAENAPVQDKPAAFSSYDKGWDASRNNDGRPLIPQMNYLTQRADLKNLYIHENGAALPYKEGVAYEENAVVVKDGVLQQWRGGDWVSIKPSHNELIGRDVSEAHPASAILDENGENQQKINDGIASIDELRLIDPKTNGRRIYLNSVIAGKNLGSGMFISTQKAGLMDNGGTIISSPDPTLFWARINYDNVTPQFWGALGDGINDDRPAFQAAVDYLRSTGGGELFLPKPPQRYMWKSYDEQNSACLVIQAPLEGVYSNPISIRGAANDTLIITDLGLGVTIEAAILLLGGGSFKRFENITVWGGSKTAPNCNYVFKGVDAYYPDFTMRNTQFYAANIACVWLATFVATFDLLRTAHAPTGTYITGTTANLSSEVTALTFNSCYGLQHTDSAFHIYHATYCSFNACAADHIDNYAYRFNLARGVSINGCGVESSMRILKIDACQGVTINGLMTLNIGDSTNPPSDLIRIDGGASLTIAGLWNQSKKGADYVLSLGSTFSTESVTVLDQSLSPSDVQSSSNFKYQRPVRFLLEDYSRKTQEVSLTDTGNPTQNATNLQNALSSYQNTELLHDIIIRFPAGDYVIGSSVYVSSTFTHGQGRIRLVGNASNNSRIVASGGGDLFFGSSATIPVLNYQLENLTLFIGAVSGANKGFNFYKGNITLINSKIASDNTYRQFYAENSPTMRLDSNSAILTNFTGSLNVEFTYKSTVAPTSSTRLPAGTIFMASDPNATRIGWINTANNGATWLALTA